MPIDEALKARAMRWALGGVKYPPGITPRKVNKILILRGESAWTDIEKDEILLYRNDKDRFFLRGRPRRDARVYSPENPNEIKEIREVPVSRRWVVKLLNRLENTKISAFPTPLVGSDGGFWELEIGGYMGMAHYRWWMKPPESWEPLDQIVDEILHRFYYRSIFGIKIGTRK